MTEPPPYSPSAIVPSKSAYSSGWSSTATASRFSPGTRLGPRVTAQLFRTPSKRQAEIVVQPGRVVLLNDEDVALLVRRAASRLGRRREVPLASIGFERHRLARLGRGAAGFAFGALLALGGNVDLARFPKRRQPRGIRPASTAGGQSLFRRGVPAPTRAAAFCRAFLPRNFPCASAVVCSSNSESVPLHRSPAASRGPP